MARSERLTTLGWAVFTFVGVTLYALLWIRHGLDATDEPANLSRHWLFLHGHLAPGSKWFSRVLGGLWLELSAPWGLFGARLGWALTQGLSALAAFGILQRVLGRATASLGVLATAIFINGFGIMATDGYTLPPLLALLATALLLRAQHPRTATGREAWFALAGGVVLGLAVLSRLPYIVLLVLPLISPLLKSALARPRDHEGWRLAGWALLGAGGVLLLSWIVLGLLGLAGPYADYLYRIFLMPETHHHSVQNMQAGYLSMLVEMVVRGGWVLVWWLGLWLLTRLTAAVMGLAWPAVAVAMSTLFLATDYMWLHSPLMDLAGLYSASVMVLVAHAVLYLAGGGLDRARFLQFTVTVYALALCLASHMGSTFLLKIRHGLWLLTPLAMLGIGALVQPVLPHLKQRYRFILTDLGPVLAALLCLMALMGFHSRLQDPYRDHTDRTLLVNSMESQGVWAVLTTKGRAEAVDDLLARLKGLVKPGDTVLAYPNLALVHLVTRTVPALVDPWPTLYWKQWLVERLQRLDEQGRLPVVVRAKADLRRRDWGHGPPPTQRYVSEESAVIDRWVAKHGYQIHWAGPWFEILVPPAWHRPAQ